MFNIANIIQLILKNKDFFLIGVLVLTAIFGIIQCDRKQEYKADVKKQKQNIEALNDSVSYYENKAGELTAEKLVLQTDKKQLKTLNEDLSKELEKEKGRVEYLTKINAESDVDTTEVDSTYITSIDIDSWRFDWNVSKGGNGWFRELRGFTAFSIDSLGFPYESNTVITRDYLSMQVITGIKEENGKRKIFVRSTYPNLEFTNIQGTILENRPEHSSPSRFGLGINFGTSVGYDGFVIPTISFGVNYNLIRF